MDQSLVLQMNQQQREVVMIILSSVNQSSCTAVHRFLLVKVH